MQDKACVNTGFSSVTYLSENPDILLLDCTYRTNKFDMPLLDILGVDSLDNGFTVSVCFMNREAEDDYQWAMRHLRSLFNQGVWPSVIVTDCDEALIHAVETRFIPTLTKMVLCYCHISMNVMKNCRKYCETEEEWESFHCSFCTCVHMCARED